jgi:hypothetical protein
VADLSCLGAVSEIPDEEEVLAIVEPYFEAAKELYLEFSDRHGLKTKALSKVRLECQREIHDTPRHFAGASTDGRLIAVAPQIVHLPEDTVAAILAHEFGHITDFIHAGQFICNAEDRRLVWMPDAGDDYRSERTRVARVRQWSQRDDHCIEVTADLIAEKVIGKRIGYSGPCLLQGFSRGVPRPKTLT